MDIKAALSRRKRKDESGLFFAADREKKGSEKGIHPRCA